MIRDRVGPGAVRASTLTFVVYTAVMGALEQRMRGTGGPGINEFALAGNARRAEDIMTRWGDVGQRAARLSLWLDFGYMATYGTLMTLLADRARQLRGHSIIVPATAIVAVAADAMEGVSLLKVLNGVRVPVHSRRAQIAALTKFSALGIGLGYLVAGRAGRHRRIR